MGRWVSIIHLNGCCCSSSNSPLSSLNALSLLKLAVGGAPTKQKSTTRGSSSSSHWQTSRRLASALDSTSTSRSEKTAVGETPPFNVAPKKVAFYILLFSRISGELPLILYARDKRDARRLAYRWISRHGFQMFVKSVESFEELERKNKGRLTFWNKA